MRRAVPVGLLVTAVLVALGLPFLHASFGYPDDRVLPHSASAHQVGDDLRNDFAANAASTITVVAPDTSAAAGARRQLRTAALVRPRRDVGVGGDRHLRAGGRPSLPGASAMRSGDATYLSVRTTPTPSPTPRRPCCPT